jgi:hypothetical protein
MNILPIETFRARIEAARQFIAAEGRSPDPKSSDKVERKLALFLKSQRAQFHNGTLIDVERADAIEALARPGFPDRYAELEEFHRMHGRLPKSKGLDVSEHSLATWLIGQRIRFKRGSLPEACQQALEKIPGALNTRAVPAVDVMIAAAQEWCRANGHLPRQQPAGRNVTSEHLSSEELEEARLANWMRNWARVGILKNDDSGQALRRRSAIQELQAKYPSRADFMPKGRVPA